MSKAENEKIRLKDEFDLIQAENNNDFNIIYDRWVALNYDKDEKPSFDRIDSKKGYSFDNIQIMTWRENNIKGRNENKKCKKVAQYTLEGNFLKQFNSISKAEADKLNNELDSAEIVEPDAIPSNVVTMNSIVKLSFLNNNKQVQFQIVYPDQGNLKENKISIFSPIATALIGYKVGDEIEWIVPAGLTNIRIDEIIYQPEAAGDFTL